MSSGPFSHFKVDFTVSQNGFSNELNLNNVFTDRFGALIWWWLGYMTKDQMRQNHVCVMHDTFTWLMVTSDVCAGFLKQRLVICETAPLTEINCGLKYSLVWDENLYPVPILSPVQRAGRDKFKTKACGILPWMLINNCMHFSAHWFSVQEASVYICMGSFSYSGTYADPERGSGDTFWETVAWGGY